MKIEIVTDGFAEGTTVTINGHHFADVASFGFFIKERADRCKLQLKRIVDGDMDAVTNLFGPEIARYSDEIDRKMGILNSITPKEAK